MIFKNSKLYDALKWVALVALDALGLAYESLSQVWNLPFGDEVAKTCTILSVLIGTLIGVSSYKYNSTETDTNTEEYDTLLNERDDE
jgi:hypothetical protein